MILKFKSLMLLCLIHDSTVFILNNPTIISVGHIDAVLFSLLRFIKTALEDTQGNSIRFRRIRSDHILIQYATMGLYETHRQLQLCSKCESCCTQYLILSSMRFSILNHQHQSSQRFLFLKITKRYSDGIQQNQRC